MDELTKKDYVNILIEGAAMFFVMVAFLFIFGGGNLYIEYHKEDFLLVVASFQAIVTWTLLYIRKIHNRLTAVLAYTFIIGTIFYAIADGHGSTDIEESSLFLVFIVMVVAWLAVRYVHNQYYKDEFHLPQYLSAEQKYAIVGLLTFIQGASPSSAYNDEVNQIVRSLIPKLDLSQQDIRNYLNSSLDSDPEEHINRLIESLKEIKDYDFIKRLHDKCMRIANISGNEEIKEMINGIFNELGI